MILHPVELSLTLRFQRQKKEDASCNLIHLSLPFQYQCPISLLESSHTHLSIPPAPLFSNDSRKPRFALLALDLATVSSSSSALVLAFSSAAAPSSPHCCHAAGARSGALRLIAAVLSAALAFAASLGAKAPPHPLRHHRHHHPLLLLSRRGRHPARHRAPRKPPGRRGLCPQMAEIDSTSITIFSRQHLRSQHRSFNMTTQQHISSVGLPAPLQHHLYGVATNFLAHHNSLPPHFHPLHLRSIFATSLY